LKKLLFTTFLFLVFFGNLPHFLLFASDEARTTPIPYTDQNGEEGVSFTRTSQYLTMRDGTQIAVDLYFPTDKQGHTRLPTMIHQTRYWRALAYRWPMSMIKDSSTRGHIGKFAKGFLANGYAWVDVDVRGSGASFGTRPYSHSPEEIQDGAEVVEWIIHQPWSNGNVGSIGISYGGASAELILANQHPALKAAAPLYSGFDLYPEIAFPGGIQLTWFTKTWSYINHQLDANHLPFVGWWSKMLVQGVAPVDRDKDLTLLQAAIQEHQHNWDPHQEGLGITFRDDPPPSIPARNIDALSPFSHATQIKKSGAAIYSYSGWFDGGWQHAAIRRHITIDNPGNKLIIGPWDHGGRRNISPYSIGPSAFDHIGELLKFFDWHLKGKDTGITKEPPIHYFTMGEEQWKGSHVWPPPANMELWYFGAERQLLTNPPARTQASDTYRVDGTAGTGKQSRWNTLVGIPLEAPYSDRVEQDQRLLTYTSPALDNDMEVTGHPLVTLHMESTSSNETVFVYLEDVDQAGHVHYVTEGMLHLLHRKLSQHDRPYTDVIPYRTYHRADSLPLLPGEVAVVIVDLLPTSYQFKKGHHIRVAIAGRDQDHFASPLKQNPHPSNTLTIHRTPTKTSHIQLPIVPQNIQ
jgi:putative CocE/NonD family hydrolase